MQELILILNLEIENKNVFVVTVRFKNFRNGFKHISSTVSITIIKPTFEDNQELLLYFLLFYHRNKLKLKSEINYKLF